jgi:hypothetical protein
VEIWDDGPTPTPPKATDDRPRPAEGPAHRWGPALVLALLAVLAIILYRSPGAL